MSYDISLKDPVTKKTIELYEPHMMRGGTYAIGGTKELWLNITYNYGDYYYSVFDDGIRHIYGMSGADSIPVLEGMISKIERYNKSDSGVWNQTEREGYKYIDKNGNELNLDKAVQAEHETVKYTYIVSEGDTSNYWEPTAANAISPLYKLIAMAKMRPDGIWDGD